MSVVSAVVHGPPTILHADLDAFYASVEQRDDPALANRPMMVGGGVVLSASYEARRLGVRTAMPSGQAKRLCPNIIEVPPRMEAYSQASAEVFEIFRDTTPEVEGLSIDEAFLDVTGLQRLVGPGRVVAERLRARVLAEVGLPISVGCATTKFLAKVASAVSKPDGLLVVEPGAELEFLHPLPVERLWGVGPVTARQLRSRGLMTAGDVAEIAPDVLSSLIGRGAAHHVHALSNNRDPRRVDSARRRRSIGSQRSFRKGTVDQAQAHAIVLEIVDRVTRRLRDADRVARTVVLRLRFDDFTQATRSHTLVEATATTAEFQQVAAMLVDRVWPLCEERGLTKLGVSLGQLSSADAVQLSFGFDTARAGAATSVDGAVDDIRAKFGERAITRARVMHDRVDNAPLLPL